MYSDLLESPSKDCFSFNDQSSPYNMAEMNEISNQTNLDYIFDSYYSSISRYNPGFELPEDCKNMSFSELFDQELFSTQENKDCKITIKIEKEESLKSCQSVDDVQDNVDCVSSEKIEENSSSFSLPKSFAPKRGITRTFIKTTEHCDVNHLIYNPFYETEDLGIDQTLVNNKTPNERFKPKDMHDNITEIEVTSHDFVGDSTNTVDCRHSSVKIDGELSSSLLKSSTPKRHRGINKISITTAQNSGDQQLRNNPFNETEYLGIDQTSVKVKTLTVKHKSEDIHDTVEHNTTVMKVNPIDCASKAKSSIDCHRLVKMKGKASSTLLNSSTTKCRYGMNKTSTKTTKDCDAKYLINNVSSKTGNLGYDKIPVKVRTPIIKHKRKFVKDSFKQNIAGKKTIPFDCATNSKKTIECQSLLKTKKKVPSKLLKRITTNLGGINKVSITTAQNCEAKHLNNILGETENVGFNQMPIKVKTPIVKHKAKVVYEIIEQSNAVVNVLPFDSDDGLKNEIHSNSLLKIENEVSPKLLTSDIPSQDINISSIKVVEDSDFEKLIYKPSCETKEDQTSMNVETHSVNHKSEDVNEIIKENFYGLKIKLVEEDHIKKEDKTHISSDVSSCTNVNNTHNKNQEISIVKEEIEKIEPNETFLKNDVNSQTSTSKNKIGLENEKKKIISWEEFRAKRKNLGLLKTSEKTEEPVTVLAATEATIKEEFDRTTVEHFIGQKRKIEATEEETTAKELGNDEDQELQNKRMKIEYIKQLLPSSFASEIAKTSSLMKGSLAEDTEIESTSDDSIMSNEKKQGKYSFTYEDMRYLKKDDKSQKKGHQNKVHSSHWSFSKSEYFNKSSRSSSASSNPDDYYNRNRIDTPLQNGHSCSARYEKLTVLNRKQRPKPEKDQKRVVYVGQIPVRFGKRYLYNRFKEFGTIQYLSLHRKPDFRVYYAFVTYSEKAEAERAIIHGNDDKSQVAFDIRFGERKQTLTPYYDLDDEWLTDWYGYRQQPPVTAVVRTKSPEKKASFEEELQAFHKLAQIKKQNQIKSSQVS